MATTTANTPRRLLTILLWLVFLSGNALLFAVDTLLRTESPYLLILWLSALLICYFALLVRYFRLLGQWRAILFSGIVCSLSLIAASFGDSRGITWLGTGGMLLAIYAMFAAWFAAVALAIRRDVSIAYLAIFFFVAPLVLRAGMVATGGVLALLQNTPSDAQPLSYVIAQTTVMVLSCLPTLAILTFVPHFAWSWVKEWRRQPLTGQR